MALAWFTIIVANGPLNFFFLAGWAIHGGKAWVAGLCLSFISGYITMWNGGVNATFTNVSRALTMYAGQSQFTFEEVEISHLIPDELRDQMPKDIYFRRSYFRFLSGLKGLFKPVRAFIVKCQKPPFPAQLKAFVNTEGTSVLFLRDDPADLTLLGRFKFYHELGHLSHIGRLWAREQFAIPWRCCITGLTVYFTARNSIWRPVILWLYLAQQWYRYTTTSRVGAEMLADRYAFIAVAKQGLLPTLFTQLEQLYEEDLHAAEVDRALKWRDRLLIIWRLQYIRRHRAKDFSRETLSNTPLSFTGIDDFVLYVLLVYLAINAESPGLATFCVFAVALVVILSMNIFLFRHILYLERRIEMATIPMH